MVRLDLFGVFHFKFDAKAARRIVFEIVMIAAALRLSRGPITTRTFADDATSAAAATGNRIHFNVDALGGRIFFVLRPAGRRGRSLSRTCSVFLASS